jgi:hypothetical protein
LQAQETNFSWRIFLFCRFLTSVTMATQLKSRGKAPVTVGIAILVMYCVFACVQSLTVMNPSTWEEETATLSVAAPQYGCNCHETSHASSPQGSRSDSLTSHGVGEKELAVFLCVQVVGLAHCVWKTEHVFYCCM